MTALTMSYVLPRRGDICDVKKFSYRKMIEISKTLLTKSVGRVFMSMGIAEF